MSEQVAEEDRDPDQALDEVLDEAVVDAARGDRGDHQRAAGRRSPIPATRVSRASGRPPRGRARRPPRTRPARRDRTSQRVPTTSVSYRTTRPRTNGSFAQRLPWKPASRRSVCPDDLAVGAAEGDRDRVATAHQDALDEGLTTVGEARHRESLPAHRGPAAHGRIAGRPRRRHGPAAGRPLGSGRPLQPLLEALDLAGRVDDRLLARVERVAVAADVDAQLGPGRADRERRCRTSRSGPRPGSTWDGCRASRGSPPAPSVRVVARRWSSATGSLGAMRRPRRARRGCASSYLVWCSKWTVAGDRGEDGVVAAEPGAVAGQEGHPALADDDRPGRHELAVADLDAEPLADAVAAVLRARACLLVGHRLARPSSGARLLGRGRRRLVGLRGRRPLGRRLGRRGRLGLGPRPSARRRRAWRPASRRFALVERPAAFGAVAVSPLASAFGALPAASLAASAASSAAWRRAASSRR